MIVVADTTPLNILVQLGLTDLLEKLITSVIIPPAVVKDLSHANTPDTVKKWLESPPPWLVVQATKKVLAGDLPQGLGEREAISLAIEIHADVLLADDRRARLAAEALVLTVTGTLGILNRAAKVGLIDLADAFERLKKTNFHVSDELLEEILKRAQGK